MLIEYGNTVALPDWNLDEKEATGYLRVYFVHEGAVMYKSKDQSCRLNAGKLYILPNAVPYQTMRIDGEKFVCTYLHVNLKEILVNGLIELPIGEDSVLYYYVHLLQSAIREERIELLESAAEQIEYFCRESEYFEGFSEFLTAVRNYIFGHISDRITIEQLSALFHYHPNYFIDVFKKETNCTPYQYILRIRMQQALLFMRQNNKLSDVALQVGYADSRSFTRAFVRYYGMTPYEYQNSRKNVP